MLQPLTAYLSSRLHMPVTLSAPADYPAFWSAVENDSFDLVHYNQYHYIRAHKIFGHRLVARNREQGRDDIRAAILVRADSPLLSLDDLHGRKVLFGGGRSAMVSYVLTVDLLRRSGLDDGDYISEFAQNPPKAVTAMYYGQGDAAAASRLVLTSPGLAPEIRDRGRLRELASTDPIPQLPWAVSRSIPEPLRKNISSALLDLSTTDAGREILRQLQIDGFSPAEDTDYDGVRALVARVLGERY